jgi:hypothetical protein
MKKALFVLALLVLIAAIAVPASAIPQAGKYAGLNIEVTPNGDGTGSFRIYSDATANYTVDVVGAWTITRDTAGKPIAKVCISGTVIGPDGTAYMTPDDGEKCFAFSDRASLVQALRSIIDWIHSMQG